jgi:hypothetical protein
VQFTTSSGIIERWKEWFSSPKNKTKEANMAKFAIKVLSLIQTSEEDGAPAFDAAGTIDGVSFAASTILWGPRGAKEPIFKVVEGDEVAQELSSSSFSRGQRIAIARACKLVRLGKAALAEKPAEKPLLEMSLLELRSKAKDLGVKGTHRKGITKAEILVLVQSA